MNAHSPILDKLFGISTEAREVQKENAPLPITVTPSGMTTFVALRLQPVTILPVSSNFKGEVLSSIVNKWCSRNISFILQK